MHARRELQSLEMHRMIAARLVADPDAVLAKAFAHLDSWLERQAGTATEAVLVEWRNLLQTLSVPEIAAFLCSEGEHAIRMRQSSPFGGILSPQEVWITKKHDATARA